MGNILSRLAAADAISRYIAALDALGGTTAREVDCDASMIAAGIDAAVEFRARKLKFLLLVRWRKNIFPPHVSDFLWDLGSNVNDRDRATTIPVMVGETISMKARHRLQEIKGGFYDGGGTLALVADRLYILIDRPQPKKKYKKVMNVLFAGSASQVVQVILQTPEVPTIVKLATAAGVANGTVSNVFAEMEKRGWLTKERKGKHKGRTIGDREEILNEWVNFEITQKPFPLTRYYVPGGRAETIMAAFAEKCNEFNIRYAVTGEAAAQSYTPYLSHISRVQVRVLTHQDIGKVLTAMSARQVDEGANLEIIETSTLADLAFTEIVGGVQLASPLRVYLDLQRNSGRAKEMAEHLRREKLKT